MHKHVLLVENEPSHQELIQTALELAGYIVTLAENGLEAFEKLATETPCVIVLDLWMPEMSGYTFLEIRRERNANVTLGPAMLDLVARHRPASGCDRDIESRRVVGN